MEPRPHDPPIVHLDPGYYDFASIEDRLRATADAELEVLSVATRAAGTLAHLLHAVQIPRIGSGSPAHDLRLATQFQLAALGVRSARSVITLIVTGYEMEALGHKRRLSEATFHAEAVSGDHSGEYARSWLTGKAPSARRAFSKRGSVKTWDAYSWSAHAEARAVLMISTPPPWIGVRDTEREIMLTPQRNQAHANRLLAETAWESMFLAVGVVEAVGDSIALQDLGADIKAAMDKWARDQPPTPT